MQLRIAVCVRDITVGLSVLAGSAAIGSEGAPLAAVAETASARPADLPAAEPVEMRFRYEPGQIIRYVTTDDSVVEVEHNAEATKVDYSTKAWKHFRVKSISESGVATLELVFDRVHMSAGGADGKAEFDSQRPGGAPAQFAHILDFIGRPSVELDVDTNGVVTAVKTFGGRSSQGSDIPTSVVAGLEREVQAPLTLPGRPVQIGDTWQERFDVPVLVEENRFTRKIKLQRSFTLASVAGTVATIEVDTIILTPINDPKLTAQLVQRTPSGVIQFDVALGHMLSTRTFLSNEVVGHEGPGSKLKVIRTFAEELAPSEDAQTAQLGPATR
jgi:hypothetical protein